MDESTFPWFYIIAELIDVSFAGRLTCLGGAFGHAFLQVFPARLRKLAIVFIQALHDCGDSAAFHVFAEPLHIGLARRLALWGHAFLEVLAASLREIFMVLIEAFDRPWYSALHVLTKLLQIVGAWCFLS